MCVAQAKPVLWLVLTWGLVWSDYKLRSLIPDKPGSWCDSGALHNALSFRKLKMAKSKLFPRTDVFLYIRQACEDRGTAWCSKVGFFHFISHHNVTADRDDGLYYFKLVLLISHIVQSDSSLIMFNIHWNKKLYVYIVTYQLLSIIDFILYLLYIPYII